MDIFAGSPMTETNNCIIGWKCPICMRINSLDKPSCNCFNWVNSTTLNYRGEDIIPKDSTMKWHPVNKFRPSVAVTDVFLRTQGGGLYAGYNEEYTDGRYIWIRGSDGEEIKGVTHFCIPGPIEIEE